ncbi:hypothetical protein M422DRAFT_219492 [Sphaerobolus stellatus SS14]|nr:hypothetical protein M422DRAFT_219492 [Sphaerobolus stellatus SS14]
MNHAQQLRKFALRRAQLPVTESSRFQCGRLQQRTYSTAVGEGVKQKSGRSIKLSHAIALTTALCTSAYLVGLFYPPPVIQMISPRAAPASPSADSEEGIKMTEQIEKQLVNLELLKKCRARPDADEWYEVRPYVGFPEERRVNSLTAGALRGPGRIAVPPVVWCKKDESEAWAFMHLGRGVCGHDGIVHGGLLATLLDEGLGRVAILNFPSRVGVTANLNLDFRAPTKADQFIVMKTKLIERKGRKAIVQGQIEDLDGNVLVEAKALFIEPKLVSQLNATGISALFPSWERKVAQMTGASASKRVEGGAQVIDIDVDEGERESVKAAKK